MPRNQRAPRRALFAALAVLGGCALALAGVEAVLRVFSVSFPFFWRSHPVLGTCLVPGMSGWQMDEGRAFVRINDAGFRDRDYPPVKPAGALRVLVLGDSFTEALQVPLEETFVKVAERELSACASLRGRTVEVMNWGCRSYGTIHEVMLLALRGWAYDPDMVVIAVYPENDLEENLAAFSTLPGDPLLAYRDGRLEWTPALTGARSRLAELPAAAEGAGWRSLRLVQLVAQARRSWTKRPPWGRGDANDPSRGDYSSRKVYAEPRDARWRRSWALFEDLLGLARRDAAARGVALLAVAVTSNGQVHPDPGFQAKYGRIWGVSDFLYPNRRLSEIGRRSGLEVLDLVPSLSAYASRRREAVHGFPNTEPGMGHWNAVGHRLAGEALAAKICAMASKPASGAKR